MSPNMSAKITKKKRNVMLNSLNEGDAKIPDIMVATGPSSTRIGKRIVYLYFKIRESKKGGIDEREVMCSFYNLYRPFPIIEKYGGCHGHIEGLGISKRRNCNFFCYIFQKFRSNSI